MLRKVLHSFIAVTIVASQGCGTLNNRFRPEKVALSAVTAESGVVLMSAGAPEKCVSTATFLNVQPAGSAYRKDVLFSLPVDVYAVKSDFVDYHGFLHAFVVKPGTYQLYPAIANPYVAPVRISKAEITVKAGEVTYVGEYYMPVSCVWNPVSEFRDNESRDIALLKTKNPALADLPRTKRIARFKGCLYGCDQ